MAETRMATKSGIFTGTTGANYVEVVRVDTRGYGYQGKTLVKIRNVGGANTIFYKIDAYLADPTGALGGLAENLVSETSIPTTTTISTYTVAANYAAIVISLKNNAGASAYQVEFLTI